MTLTTSTLQDNRNSFYFAVIEFNQENMVGVFKVNLVKLKQMIISTTKQIKGYKVGGLGKLTK